MATGHVRDGCIFPVGFIVQLTTDADPAEFFGGKWQRIKGRFLLAADDEAYPAGSTGGEAEHKLTVAEMPNHNHLFFGQGTYATSASNLSQAPAFGPVEGNTGQKTGNTGGGQAHNNMPPYRSVYIWERIG